MEMVGTARFDRAEGWVGGVKRAAVPTTGAAGGGVVAVRSNRPVERGAPAPCGGRMGGTPSSAFV